jgi:peptidoglycan hydrolase CwlO-like protein
VADNSTRVALEDAIKTANDLLGQNKPDTVAMQKALTGLQTASDSVKASMNDLVVQNQIAAQQQAQQQYLQQQTPTQQSQQGQQSQQQTPAQPYVPAPPADPNSSA